VIVGKKKIEKGKRMIKKENLNLSLTLSLRRRGRNNNSQDAGFTNKDTLSE
jgi:hypothetical protein